jgi:hypothetical protein
MSAAESSRFDQIAQEFDSAVNAIRQRLDDLGIAVTDWSNRWPQYDSVRFISYTFTKAHSVDGEQQMVTVSAPVLEPTAEGEEPVINLTTKAERFWMGQRSHWESSDKIALSPAEFLESDLAQMICRLISDSKAKMPGSI